MSEGKVPAEKLAALPKDVKDALRMLETQVGDALKELEKFKPVKGEAAESVEEMRKVIEDRVTQLRSLMDKYIADAHITGDLKSDFKRLSGQLPELTSKLQESIRKQATSIYTDRIKVFADNMKSSLKRLRKKIGY
nr:hypothetical protein [Candidatus Njordarchaeum guaymaensis]